jgi:hypothetical protein
MYSITSTELLLLGQREDGLADCLLRGLSLALARFIST